MGAGRKKETYRLPEKSQPRSTVNCRDTARNLRTTDLGAVIFGCKNKTMKECFTKKLFGLPAPHMSYVKNVKPGMPLFLFNYSDRKLHGIFEAVSQGKLNIDPYGWTEGDSKSSPYPAQVKFRIQVHCQPLYEDQFGPVISENYYEAALFWFELDHVQTKKLISLFASAPVSTNNYPLGNTKRQGVKLKSSSTSEVRQGNIIIKTQILESGITYPAQGKAEWSSLFKTASSTGNYQILESLGIDGLPEKSEQVVRDVCQNSRQCFSPVVENMYASVADNDHNGDSNKSYSSIVRGKDISRPGKELCSHLQTGTSSNSLRELEGFDRAASKAKLSPSSCPSEEWESRCTLPHISHVDEACPDKNLEGLKPKCDVLYSAAVVDTDRSLPLGTSDGTCSNAGPEQETEHFNKTASEIDSSSSSTTETYVGKVPSLAGPYFNGESESLGSAGHVATGDQGENILYSKNVSFGMQSVIDKLMQEVAALKLSHLQNVQKVNTLEQELVESKKEIQQLKHRCRTFNGGQPEATELESIHGSNIADSILIMGGFDGTSWLADLDLYFPLQDLRKPLCPMRSVRPYASSVLLNSDLYVIGGGNDHKWYDTVESYSLVSKKWVSCPSLSQRKGSLAGVSLNEKIFAVGGGNGAACLSEVEVLDMNIGKWIRSQPMLNEVSAVEVYEPRMDMWMMGESMNDCKGYYSSAVLGDTIYVIGGLMDNGGIIDRIECYQEGFGWHTTDLKSVGKRAFSCAVVL